MIKRFTKWIKRPKQTEVQKEFERLNWELMHDDRGQRWIYLFKILLQYDRNPREINEDLRVCDIIEGKKDAIRTIENLLQDYDNKSNKESK